MTFKTGITPNRAFCLYHLRVNPNNIKWTAGKLEDTMGKMCDVGLACNAFNIPTYHLTNSEAEYKLSVLLEMPPGHVSTIYGLNDSFGLKFDEVADVLEEYFKQTGDTILSPIAMWDKMKKQKAAKSQLDVDQL